MANIVPDAFKTNLLKGVFNFDTSGNGGNTFKCALYTSIAGYSANSTVYQTGNEVSSTNTAYPTAGKDLTNAGVAIASNIAFIDFDDLTFQHANYHMGRTEWEYWFDTETVNKVREDRIAMAVGAKRRLEALEGNINLFDSNDEIIDGIKALLTPGHSPGHMSFEVGKSSQKALVIGDALNNHHVAFRRPEWVSAGLDQDPNLAADTRKKLLEKIVSEQLKVVGFHLPNGGIGHVEKIGSGYNFVNS